ncbi:MFS general substrate transporter [Phanerochaete sordida]|uniref:MFS general substrate transporter n=1 Tax=Phanerochaete sordida TaxID=48140 RepID=A0A9P3LKY7_9APHY|nr:MFS general substrate transporter [Phanerochaete sordida]
MDKRDDTVVDDPEKTVDPSASSIDFGDKDEALKLVGLERVEIFTEAQYRRVRWKLDLVIVPLCQAVYCSQFLDKNVLNYASIMGLPVTGQHYNLIALAFYLGFLIWVFPTMYISQRLRLGKYLGINIVLWGMIMMLHAVPKAFGPFFILRLLLGMLESCVAPILILIISMFYTKKEQAQRISWFYLMNGVSGIFGGFVAYGISFDTSATIAPYKIMYLLTGGLAILVGIAVLIWMPDSPLHAVFLSKKERIIAVERIRDGQVGTENKTIKKYQIVEAFMDVRSWIIFILTIMTSIPNGGLSNFGNIIIKSFGYTSQQALILSSPIGAVGIISALLGGWYSDKTSDRMLPIVYARIPTIIGAGMLVGLKSTPANKGALLFADYIVSVFGSSLAIVYAWNASNTGGHTKKVTVNALTLSAFCIGNIVGAETFLPKDAPNYVPGKTAMLVLLVSSVGLCFAIRIINLRLNAKKRRHIQDLKERNGWSDADVDRERQRHAFLDMTDYENPYFTYTS